MRHPLVPLLCALLAVAPQASERVKIWVALRDKGPSASGLSGRAFEDAPVSAACLDALRRSGLEVSVVLKWQNKVSGWIEAGRLGDVRVLGCVRGVEEMPRRGKATTPPASAPPPALGRAAAQDFGSFQSLFTAVGGGELRDTVAARGLRPGEGVRVAVMDDGFLLGHHAFDSLFARGAIADQWDFVGDTAAAVSRAFGSSHGASTLSQIGGDLPGVLQGLAPHARFLLYRTEDAVNERYVEEDYLAAALERAVDSGAQVISISLGYRYDFDSGSYYPHAQMDGRTRPSSLAAAAAARRGALVVVAIGNEGASRFGEPTVTAPSDADSILAVGAVNSAGGRCSYSGTGPTADARVKPEIASLGCGMSVANPSTESAVWNQSGTSFAAPVVAGVAVLLRQLHPDSIGISAQRIRKAIAATGAQSGSPDNLTGNGLLRAAAAHRYLLPQSVIGILPWRDGQYTRLPWANVNPAGARVWDLLGRSRPVTVSWAPDGSVLLETSRRMAAGAYILNLPAGPDSTAPR